MTHMAKDRGGATLGGADAALIHSISMVRGRRGP
jgi:hypothetical protein